MKCFPFSLLVKSLHPSTANFVIGFASHICLWLVYKISANAVGGIAKLWRLMKMYTKGNRPWRDVSTDDKLEYIQCQYPAHACIWCNLTDVMYYHDTWYMSLCRMLPTKAGAIELTIKCLKTLKRCHENDFRPYIAGPIREVWETLNPAVLLFSIYTFSLTLFLTDNLWCFWAALLFPRTPIHPLTLSVLSFFDATLSYLRSNQWYSL